MENFREAMTRGLGRYDLKLDHTEDVEKYREIVIVPQNILQRNWVDENFVKVQDSELKSP